MKLLISLIFLIFSNFSFAQSLNLEMQDATLKDLSDAVFRGILARDFVVSPDSDLTKQKITVSLHNKSQDEILKYTTTLLAQNGFKLTDREGVLYLDKSTAPAPIPTQTTEGIGAGATDFLNTQKTTTNPDLLQQSQPTKNQSYFVYKSKYRIVPDKLAFLQSLSIKSIFDNDLIILIGDQERLALVGSILQQYDRPTDDIVIKVSIVEFTDKSNSGYNLYASLTSANSVFKIGTSGALSNSLTITGQTFEFVLSNITQDSKFNVLNTSLLRVTSGKPARINVGNDVPVLNNFTVNAQGQAIQSVDYKNSGLILDITPTMVDNTILADLNQQLSTFSATTTSAINSPTLSKRQLQTTLNAKLNDIYILGGLDSTQNDQSTNRLFGLPVAKTNATTKSTLFVIVQFLRG